MEVQRNTLRFIEHEHHSAPEATRFVQHEAVVTFGLRMEEVLGIPMEIQDFEIQIQELKGVESSGRTYSAYLGELFQEYREESQRLPFLLRRSAFRVLSSPSVSILPTSRSITTSPRSILQSTRQSKILGLQRRYASDEVDPSEPKPDEKAATEGSYTPTSSNSTDAPTGISADSDDHSTVDTAISSATSGVSRKASDVYESAAESAENAKESVSDGLQASAAAAGLDFTPKSRRDQGSFSKPERSGFSAPEVPTTPTPTLYVGNIFFDVTEDELKQTMSKFGNVISVRIIYDSRGLSKGFGYIEYDNVESAANAIEQFNQQVYQGRRVTVQYLQRRPPKRAQDSTRVNPPSKTLFIGNMSFNMTDTDLNELFREINNVIDVRVAIDRKTGQPRGFAHADFIDVSSASDAKDKLNDKEIYGRKLRIDFSGTSALRMAQDKTYGKGPRDSDPSE
ncbi:MAG: hypothetical protein M1827_007041 [Pycnora praestabilis]|nr:MAG: hypothetical protein M1827_007041 [Pycnora praestabilis]